MNNCGLLQFALARGIGEATIKKAIAFIGHNGISWDKFINDANLLHRFGLGAGKIESIHMAKALAQNFCAEMESKGIVLLAENDLEYPQYLKMTLGENCPAMLFAAGNLNLLNSISVGFCGSRKASEKGLRIAADCAEQLAEKHITVVSGYATGTDLAAHKAALQHNGNTIFVLAEGILRTSWKKEIRELITGSNHVYISQFMPNSVWNVGNAMRRNSVIIGLSRAMILVESGKTGGTFAAGEEALRVGCPLFVIHFAQPEVSAEANPYFLDRGAQPIRGRNGVPNISKILDVVNRDFRSKSQTLSPDDGSQLSFLA